MNTKNIHNKKGELINRVTQENNRKQFAVGLKELSQALLVSRSTAARLHASGRIAGCTYRISARTYVFDLDGIREVLRMSNKKFNR